MPDKDPTHWLFRLTSEEWLRASAHELVHARRAFERKSQREAVVYCRRGAGMVVNALLWHREDERYGRTYMEHLAQLAKDELVPEAIRLSAALVLAMPLQGQLVQLGSKGDPQQAEPAERIWHWVKQRVEALHQPN